MTAKLASLRFAASLIGIVITVPCFAGAGDLDSTFGIEGRVVTDMGWQGKVSMDRNSLAMQSDGKMVVVGYGGGGTGFATLRFGVDGTLDESFGNGGKSVVDFYPYGSPSRGTAVAIQPDGKIVVGGMTFGSGSTRYDFALVRLDPDGHPDPGFGTDGRVATDFGDRWEFGGSASDETIEAIALTTDGNILAVGPLESSKIVLARYRPNGALDHSFGVRGVVITDVAGANSLNVAVLPNSGKILVSGYSEGGKTFLARYHPTGSLDETFGVGGIIVYTDIRGGRALAIQPDGKVLLGGATGGGFALYRVLADGTPDTSFGTGGSTLTDFGIESGIAAWINSIAIYPDGRIVAIGYQEEWINAALRPHDFALARYLSDGMPDTTFGTDGKVVTSFDYRQANALAAAIQADEKVVIAGVVDYSILGLPTSGYIVPSSGHVALARYDPDGSLDATFGANGKATADLEYHTDDSLSDVVAVQADGKIVAAVAWSGPLDQDFGLVRYNPDGTLDGSFGNAGQVTTDLSWDFPPAGCQDYRGPGVTVDTPRALAVQPDGKIVVAGKSTCNDTGESAFALVRYNPDGSLDATFGTGGKVITHFGTRHVASAEAIALQADGKLVVAGYSRTRTPGPPFEFALARYHPDGTLDATFGNSGRVTTNVSAGNDYGRAIALQEDGKIVVLGNYLTGLMTPEAALVRYGANGSIDTSFGVNGRVTGSFATQHFEPKSMTLQADGKIVVAGNAGAWNWPYNFELRRLNSDGSLDTTFGSAGIVSTDFGDSQDVAAKVAAQADGRLVVAGRRTYFLRSPGPPGTGSSVTDFAVARYNADGTLDYTFGTGGRVTTDFGASAYDEAASIAVQPDGKIIVGGYTWIALGYDWGAYTAGHWDIALARYEGVSTKSDILEGLVFTIQDLAATGLLNHGQATALQAPLQAAVQQVGRGNTNAAVKQLEAFLATVDTFERNGILSALQRDLLYDAVSAVIGEISL